MPPDDHGGDGPLVPSIVPSVLNAPPVRAVLGDGALGAFALRSIFDEWLHFENFMPFETAKGLTKNPGESHDYISWAVPESLLVKAFLANAARNAGVMEVEKEPPAVNEAIDGSAKATDIAMVNEIATFRAALQKQTWLRQRSVFDLDALHQDLSLLRFAMDKGILEKDAHDDILISLLGVQPSRGKGHDEMDRERRLDLHRKKARRISSELLLDCKVLHDFPTIFLLDSREIALKWWRSSTLIHNYRVVIQRFIAVLQEWPAMLGWKEDLLSLLHTREGDDLGDRLLKEFELSWKVQ